MRVFLFPCFILFSFFLNHRAAHPKYTTYRQKINSKYIFDINFFLENNLCSPRIQDILRFFVRNMLEVIQICLVLGV
ncbi:hypothetical protein HOLDEFILI_00692 [Holdemania filiformis DSM 12042]|uniref:Uncharacterized protein n=1 Tax=Holdemania filiformis DSM 12042 TaxID=545696 RepID=B9Y4G1_9FIRM|nr:hypothetical protein HOLDEFILI_00692 [Holdemania filiformis DSM 12042]